MGESGVGTPQITHPQAGVAREPGSEDRRANVLAALAADGLFPQELSTQGFAENVQHARPELDRGAGMKKPSRI